MRRTFIVLVSVLTGCILAFVAGCANTGIKHVSPDEFLRQARTMEQLNSASGTVYIGTSPTRAYVERTGLYRVLRCHKAMVYWTELEGLPPDIRGQLKAGARPWTSWQSKGETGGEPVSEGTGGFAPVTQP